MENSILSELQWNADGGALTFNDVRYLLIRPETLIAFQTSLEAEIGVERAGEILYAGGFAGGRLSGRKYRETLGLSGREAVQFMCRMGGEIGWGRFEIKTLDVGSQRLEIDVQNSPFAGASHRPAIGDLSHPVCHLIRGVLGGLWSGVLGAEVRARETMCLGRRDSCCRFEVESVP